jgi:hypothetical protein
MLQAVEQAFHQADNEGAGHGSGVLMSRQLKVLCHTIERHWPSWVSVKVPAVIAALQSSFPLPEKTLLMSELTAALSNYQSMDLASVKGVVLLLYYKYFGDTTTTSELEALQEHASSEREQEQHDTTVRQQAKAMQDVADGAAVLASEGVLEVTVCEYLRLFDSSTHSNDNSACSADIPLLKLDRDMPLRELLQLACAAACSQSVRSHQHRSRLGAGRAAAIAMSQRPAPSEDFGFFCPVSWIDSRKLVNGAAASTQSAESVVCAYAGRSYHLANAEAASIFMQRPEYYSSHSSGPLPAPPSEFPSIITRPQLLGITSTVTSSAAPEREPIQESEEPQALLLPPKARKVKRLVDLRGYCPVEWAKEGGANRSFSQRLKPGAITRLVKFAGATFALSSEKALEQFMQQPALFVSIYISALDSRASDGNAQNSNALTPVTSSPEPMSEAKARAKLMVLPKVPSTFAPFRYSFSELSLVLLTDSLSRVHKLRPHLPNKSTAEAAVIHLALHMRAHNPAIGATERADRMEKLKRFEKDCDILARLRSSGAWAGPESDTVAGKGIHKRGLSYVTPGKRPEGGTSAAAAVTQQEFDELLGAGDGHLARRYFSIS